MKRILLLSLLLLPIVALAQYPTFSNKQKLGVQTTGDGLIFRGNLEVPNYQPSNVNNAYFYLDTVRNTLKFYKDGWIQIYPSPQFDTTTLNVYLKISDTTAMLLPYFRDSDTTSLNLINRFALKLNISDTATMLTPYMKKADTISLSNRIDLKLNISDTTILSNRITTNANNIITINNKLATKLDTIYTKFKDVVKMIVNKDTINIGSSLTDGYAINIIGDSVNVDTTLLDIRYSDRDTTNELQDITFATTAGIITISGGKVMNLDTLYNSVIDSVNLLIRDSIAAFTPLTEGYGINIIGDSINVDTSIIFTQSDTITLSNRIDLKLNTSDTITLSNRIDTKLNASDTVSLSNRIDLKLNISDTLSMLAPYLREADTISLSNRINTKLDTIYVNYQTNVDVVTNKDTINIIPLTEGFGINIIGDSINIDSAVILTTQQKQIAYVKNQSGATMYKGQAVYSSGSTGDNKLVLLASSSTEQTSSKTFGVVESDSIPNGTQGYIITFGLLSGFNTNGLTEGSSVYLSSTPGQLTTTKPQAPLHLVTIGICIREQQNTGSIFVKIQNGFELDEIHDVRITSPVNNASLYYSGGLWRDTTATLLISDTASMLNPYLRKLDTILLSNRIDLRVKYADTTSMLLPYFRTNDTTLLNLNSRLSIKLNLSDTTNMLSKYVNTYSNQIDINGDKTFNNVITIDSATVTGKLLVNTNISDAVKINSNTNSTNLELMNNNGTVSIKSTNRNMVLQTDTTALMYLNGETNRVGILTMTPEQALQVAGTIRVDSLVNNLTPDKLVGANNANDLTDIKIGNGLSFSNDTLKVADNIINSGDTATLLRQDFLGINTNVLTWQQGSKKLLPYFTQVYRNGQLLKSDSQYTITNDSIVTLEEGSYRLGDNITIIAIDNIIALAGGGGIITLQGDVTGSSSTNTITTTIGVNKVTNTMLAGSISDNKLNTITTAGKVSNSATTATNLNTNNAIVLRDNSGNFSAGTITATLNGNALTATNVAYSGLTGTVPTWNQNTTGNAATVTTNANLTGDVTSTGNATSIATEVIVNADINASAAIAVSKLAASTISGVTLGNYLNTLTISSPLTGTSYNGSSAVTIGIQAATTSVAGSMSAADKTKLDGIAAGAQVNVPTNLAQGTRTTTTVPITSSTGTTATLNIATTSLAGVMSSADKTKLDGIASGATANTGTVTSVNGTGTVSGLTLTGTVTSTGNLTLGGTLSLTSGNVTTALGYTPYNATNPNSYITSSALSPYATLASPTFTGTVVLPSTTSIGTVTNTEIGYVDGVTSSIQTQLNAKQNTLTSGVTIKTINNVDLLSSGNLDVQTVLSAATSTVSGFLLANDWVTFNGKQNALNGTGFVKASGTSISYDNTSYLPLTGGILTGGLTGTTAIFSGNVAIGGTTPLNLFEVSKSNNGTSTSIRITNSFSTTGSTDETADIDFYQGSEGGYFTSGRIRSFKEGDYFTSNLQITGGLSFWTQSSNTTASNGFTEKMRITAEGNVGIGVEDATNKLDVNGTLRVRTTNTVAPTSILGKDNTGVVGEIIVGNGLTLSNSTLSLASGGGFITTNSNYTVTITDTWIVFNNSFDPITVTLPNASTSTGRTLYFRNVAAGSIVSAGTANIIDNTITTGTPNNNILGAGNTSVKWCTLVSNGQYWIKMQAGSL